jgi:hypothetical protein
VHHCLLVLPLGLLDAALFAGAAAGAAWLLLLEQV